MTGTASVKDLGRLDIRAGTRKPASKLWIDFRSEVLTLGVCASGRAVVLLGPDRPVPDGSRLG